MLLHEFQAKKLLSGFGIAAPMGDVATSAAEARDIAERLGCRKFAVKAQLHTSDRAERDAIRYALTPDEVGAQAQKLIGREFAVAGGAGETVARVLVEEFVEARRELYAAITLERSTGHILLFASAHGGSGIEARAAAQPDVLVKRVLQLDGRRLKGDLAGAAREVAEGSDLELSLAELFRNMAAAFVACDALDIDINPLVLSAQGQLVAVDAKITVDDNAAFRQPEIAAMQADNDRIEGNDWALEAQRYNLNFLKLDGAIGVAVNGAGLALATHDMIHDRGGRPANFMDIRTTATSLDIAHGFEILLRDPGTRSLLVNVQGGGMQRCDTIAEGLGIALRRSGRKLPIVIRLAGNNADFARTVLANNGVDFIAADTMSAAVDRVVELTARKAA